MGRAAQMFNSCTAALKSHSQGPIELPELRHVQKEQQISGQSKGIYPTSTMKHCSLLLRDGNCAVSGAIGWEPPGKAFMETPQNTASAKTPQAPPCAALRMLTKKSSKPSHTFLMQSHELHGCRKQLFHITAANSPKKVLNVLGRGGNAPNVK